jgi:protein phosphatase
MSETALQIDSRVSALTVPDVPVADRLPGAHAGLSDAGRSRAHNEDAWRIDPALGLMVLADGMGGYNAGEVASAIAVESVTRTLSDPWAFDQHQPAHDQLAQAVHAANADILAAAARRPECLGMGTTLVLAWLRGRSLRFAHVGDSRLYLLRGGHLHQLTRDHSVGQAMIDAGLSDPDGARESSMRGVLTRALGVEPQVLPDYGELDLMTGDRLLMCSDGLTDMVDDREIRHILLAHTEVGSATRALIDRALEQGGFDNVTALMLCVGDAERSRG